jgi:hypothetical protein
VQYVSAMARLAVVDESYSAVYRSHAQALLLYRLIALQIYNSLWPGLSVSFACLAARQTEQVDDIINDEFSTS